MPETEATKSEPTPTAPKRSHRKKAITAPADPPAPQKETKTRTRPDGWTPKDQCGVLLVPKPLIAKLKVKAHSRDIYLWQLVQQALNKVVE